MLIVLSLFMPGVLASEHSYDHSKQEDHERIHGITPARASSSIPASAASRSRSR